MRVGGAGPIPWAVEPVIPALAYPVFGPPAAADDSSEPRPVVSWVIIELNRKVLHDEIFPELAERYFGGEQGYRIAIVAGEGRRIIYASDAGFDPKPAAKAEATINLFGPPLGPPGPGTKIFLSPAPPLRQSGNRKWEMHGVLGMMHFESLPAVGEINDWQLVVQHRNGSLENFVAANRRRSLAISFGVLFVLAATMAIIVVTSRRAQRLARLQMDFVAAVSHELRTPLSVILSAADNITDGLVESQQQVVRYGKAIKSQARQLIQLVEQVLLFAATRQHGNQYCIRPVEVSQALEAALESTADLIQAAGFTVEKEIEPNLPSLQADPAALSQCLQNLITNAVKYGGLARWLGVRACLAPNGGAAEVQISVQDKGVGIAPAELEQIFEPFFRSPSVASAQIHGTGLGLPLAKSIVEAMNGRLTVSSHPGRGSTFVLHLPVAAPGQVSGEVKQSAAVCAKIS